MAKRTYVSNIEAEFFNEHKLMSGNKPPVSGEYTVGDIVISNVQLNGIFGWVCTENGEPGKWVVINDLSELSSNIEQLIKKDDDVTGEIEQIINNITNIQKEITNIENTEISEIKTKLDNLDEEFNKIDHSIYATKDELEKANSNINTNKNDIDTLKMNVVNNTNSLNELKSDNVNIKNDIKKINEEMDIIEELAGGIDLSGFATNTVVNNIKTQVETNTKDISTLKVNVNTNANNINANNVSITNNSKLINNNTTKINENTNNISQLITKVNNNSKDISSNMTTINNTVNRINELEESIADIDHSDYATIDSVNELRDKVTENTKNVGTINSKIESLEKNMTGLEEHNHDDKYYTESEVDSKLSTTLEDAKEYADTQITNLIDSAPDAMNTLNELAEAINDHQDVYEAYVTQMSNNLNNKADKEQMTEALNNKADKEHEHSNFLKYWTGTQSEYDALENKEQGTLYVIIETIAALEIDYSCTGIYFSQSGISINMNEPDTVVRYLPYNVSPNGCIDPVTYHVDKENIVDIVHDSDNNQFNITGKSEGSCILTVECGQYTDECSISVIENIKCTSISLNKTSESFEKYDTVTLKATVEPTNTTDDIVWTSSNNSVARIDSTDGAICTLYGVSTGNCTVTAKCGDKTATCSVSVYVPNVACTGVSFESSDISLTVGEQVFVNVDITPSDCTDYSSASVGDSGVAQISSTVWDYGCYITGVSTGSTTLTYKCGNYSDTCSINVSPLTCTSISCLSSLTANVGDGGTHANVTTVPAACVGDVTASTSNSSVATVSKASNGHWYIKPQGSGSCTVTFSCGDKTATCSVTVNK